MFESPREREITQGTIFSCARSENYGSCEVLGLVITARCDAAQDKVPVFSYVPVVRLRDWTSVDGAALTFDRAESDCLNTMKSLLKSAKLSDSLLRTHQPRAIYDAHFAPRFEEKGFRSTCEKYLNTLGRLDDIHAALEVNPDRKRVAALLNRVEPIADGVLKDLVGHRLSGYYLLQGLDTLTNKDNYVALLREVHHVPTRVARQIASGINSSEWRGSEDGCPRFRSPEDVAMPVAKLRSPWIEHLMQNFAMLFSRIGVADSNFEEIKQTLKAS